MPAPSPPSLARHAPRSSRGVEGALLLGAAMFFVDFGEALVTPTRLTLSERAFVLGLESGVSALVMLIAFVILVVAAQARSPERSPHGLVLTFGVGVALAGLASLVRIPAESYAACCIGALIAAFGGAPIPIGTSYVALAVEPRASAFAVAVWLAVGTLASFVGNPLAATALRTPILVVTALACLGAGATIAYFARPLHRRFEPPLGPTT